MAPVLRGQTSDVNFVAKGLLERHHDLLRELDEAGAPKALLTEIALVAEELTALANPAGISRFGEDLVARWVSGRLAEHYKDGHDVVAANGALIEVKFSKLNTPVKGRPIHDERGPVGRAPQRSEERRSSSGSPRPG